jgi:hypothetical protein
MRIGRRKTGMDFSGEGVASHGTARYAAFFFGRGAHATEKPDLHVTFTARNWCPDKS